MKRILVALDATDNAPFVLERATEMARMLGAKLKLLNIVTVAVEVPPPAAFAAPFAPLTEAAVDVARARLTKIEAALPEELRDGIALELGIPSEAICRYAYKCEADLIVIGAHAHGAIARMLGTTAAYVVNHADRPVLVVRPPPIEKDKPFLKASPHEHALLEATAITGGVVGAAVGAIGGPPGAIAGGAIGTAVGMLAGVALDEESARESAHDHELDDDIGVTSGDLGAREQAAAALTALQEREAAQR
jgi:nucleotide-binding universal stress UspA family protein